MGCADMPGPAALLHFAARSSTTAWGRKPSLTTDRSRPQPVVPPHSHKRSVRIHCRDDPRATINTRCMSRLVVMTFADKVIIVTGASEGIGAELARQLAPEKPKLVLAARRMDLLQAVVAQCVAAGAEAVAVRCDVGIEADCRALVESTVAHFGRIDMLVNNAGVSGHARFEDVVDFKWYEDMMRVNFMGSVWCTRYALPELRKAKGLVVGIASLAGKVGIPERTAYSPSKFAQAGFFEALRTELMGSGIDVTVVFPGVVATNIRLHGYGADGK